MHFTSLSTARLTIRRFLPTDADRLIEYRNDPHAARMQGWNTTFTKDDARSFIAGSVNDAPGRSATWFQFAVADSANDELVGDVGFYTSSSGDWSRVGYTVHPSARGNGFALEAAERVIEFAFEQLRHRLVIADTLDSNLASLRVLYQLGFTASGLSEPEIPYGQLLDYTLWSGSVSRPKTIIGLLTGGQSSRMGSDKATKPVKGMTMARRVAEACARTGLATVVLGPNEAGTGLPHLPDAADAPAGPLAGLVTLLREHPDTNVILVATDQPFAEPTTLIQLALQPAADTVVPIHEGHPQVTLARYGPETIEHMAQVGATRLRDLLACGTHRRVEPEVWEAWGEDGRSFRSLDRPADIEAATADFSDAPRR